MGRKTLILTENQLNEICGTNTAYLDNDSDYAEDGTITMKTGGAVSDSNGEKEYSEPVTGDDISDDMAPETLWALLFRNGGNGLWGHWGTGLRTNMLDGFDNIFDDDIETDDDDDETYYEIEDEDDDLKKYFSDEDLKYLFEEVDPEANWEEELFYKCLSYLKKTEYKDDTNLLVDTLYKVIDHLKDDNKFNSFDFKGQVNIVVREVMKKIDYEYYWQEYAGQPLPRFDYLFEDNSELRNRTWCLDLDRDGKKKTYTYTNLTTKKTELKNKLNDLVKQGASKDIIRKAKSAYAGICRVLDRETGAIKTRKKNRMNLGMENQFQKPGGHKNSGNGKRHSTKIMTDPNVGTGIISYS